MVLTATGSDGLTVDGKPFSGEMRLGADTGPTDAARGALGDRRLVVLVREGVWGVRDFDPDSAARHRFPGIDATPYDARWAVPARFTPYAEDRTVRAPNADGREGGLGLVSGSAGNRRSSWPGSGSPFKGACGARVRCGPCSPTPPAG
ncbi:hypothetical protein OV320_2170 [Actinobacteria bacterium OV320]|nr:hypothetical protein OV320_2170 [Actinobacteria bacterium OV320]